MRHSFIPKADLASAYFPYISSESARHKLMAMIHDNATLMHSLTASGYTPRNKVFSPLQVDLIFAAFGNPFH